MTFNSFLSNIPLYKPTDIQLVHPPYKNLVSFLYFVTENETIVILFIVYSDIDICLFISNI